MKLPELIGSDLQTQERKEIKLSKEEEMKLLKDVLKRKGLLDDNEELTEENFNKLIEFAKINKNFIMKDK